MNHFAALAARAEQSRPIRVGIIGAGKFAAMFLAQVPRTPGIHVAAIADLSVARASENLARVGWPPERYAAPGIEAAVRAGTTFLCEDASDLISSDALDVIVECTGDPLAGCRHALAAIEAGKHLVMVNVEADALLGPELAARARAAGLAYSLAYGDQPALIVELVDWARVSGFEVLCAGKGTRYLPAYHQSTPETVWGHYGFSAGMVSDGELNPRMFNSFLDGTKSAIEMAAVANATGLAPQPGGLAFPPCGTDDLASVCAPRELGGQLAARGTVEVVSSLARDGGPVPNDLRWGVYVTFAAGSEYVMRCFREYGVRTNAAGDVAALYRPYHFIGLELGVSVAAVGLHGQPTGTPRGHLADAVAVAKRPLAPGERLDGEGGYTVYARLAGAAESTAHDLLPIGLCAGRRLKAPVAAGATLRMQDVELDEDPVIALRRAMVARGQGPARDGLKTA